MLVRRFYDDRLAQASYLIGCQRTGDAIVIDPARDIEPYLRAAKADGVRISRVTETHIHADFVSGARELAARTGAQLLLSGEGGADWQYGYAKDAGAQLLHDHDVIVMGGVRLDVWHVPGHTPEHLMFVVTDVAVSGEPVAMVTGDFVFVGDVGRPDLLERAAHMAGTKEAGAAQLFRSLSRLVSLPDHLQVWPGHGAGSACGKALGAMPTSTLGYERRTNWALGQNLESAFIVAVLEGQPPPPTYFGRMKQVNRDGPPLLGERGAPRRLASSELDDAMATGVVVDVRPAAEYAKAHRVGTLNIPLIKAFTTWAGWLIPGDIEITLVADSDTIAEEAQRALASIGLDRVRGVLDPSTLTGAGASTRKGDVKDVPAMLAAGRTVIDLREANEWAAGHIVGATHHPLGTIPVTLAAMDRTTPVAVHCQGGTRSAIGASLLERMGFTDVIDLSAGYSGWTQRNDA